MKRAKLIDLGGFYRWMDMQELKILQSKRGQTLLQYILQKEKVIMEIF